MNYLFAPNEERAQNFLKENRFGLDDRTVIRLDYHIIEGQRYQGGDTLYILDGVHPNTIAHIQRNVALNRTKPQVVSVEER